MGVFGKGIVGVKKSANFFGFFGLSDNFLNLKPVSTSPNKTKKIIVEF